MLRSEIFEILVCPGCKGPLERVDAALSCEGCAISYPIIDGIPVLISDDKSLFSISDFIEKRNTTYCTPSWLGRLAHRIVPSISVNLRSRSNFKTFFDGVRTRRPSPRVLIIGGAVEGKGMGSTSLDRSIQLIETDVAFGDRTALICDAHDLPFADGSMDGVIAQAVLEHVIDPFRCVNEVERVLASGGLVYAETPFMQAVHMGRFDFFRFSHLGHRKLFQRFSELSSGPVAGAGTSLAWAYAFFLRSFFSNRKLQSAAFAFGSLTGFWLKYFDHLLIDNPGSFDAASAFYFVGQKSDAPIDNRRLIAGYRGGFQ